MHTIDDILRFAGGKIRDQRKALNLSQQQLADELHRAKRHIQRIELGRVNMSFDVLYSLIRRLGLSADALLNPDMSETEQEMRHLNAKLASCTDEERQIIIQTMDYMATQFLSLHQTQQTKKEEKKELTGAGV